MHATLQFHREHEYIFKKYTSTTSLDMQHFQRHEEGVKCTTNHIFMTLRNFCTRACSHTFSYGSNELRCADKEEDMKESTKRRRPKDDNNQTDRQRKRARCLNRR